MMQPVTEKIQPPLLPKCLSTSKGQELHPVVSVFSSAQDLAFVEWALGSCLISRDRVSSEHGLLAEATPCSYTIIKGL
jgi:hypothetical protein